MYITSYKFKKWSLNARAWSSSGWSAFFFGRLLAFSPFDNNLGHWIKISCKFLSLFDWSNHKQRTTKFLSDSLHSRKSLLALRLLLVPWRCRKVTSSCWHPSVLFQRGAQLLGYLAFIPVYLSSPSASVPIKALHLDVQEAKFTDWLICWLTRASRGQSGSWQHTYTHRGTRTLTQYSDACTRA